MTMSDRDKDRDRNRGTATDRGDDALDGHFAALRAETVVPSQDLMARVMVDAAGVQRLRHAPLAAKVRQPAATRWWHATALLGGLKGMAGLATATLAGVWIGIHPPAPVAALEDALLATPIVLQLDEGLALDLDE